MFRKIKRSRALNCFCPNCILYLTVYVYQSKIEILLTNAYRKARHQNTIWHARVIFFKTGVNIQTLTHLACLLENNSCPSRGRILSLGVVAFTEASSQNGKVKFLPTYSTKKRACVLHNLLKDVTFVTNGFCGNARVHELHLTSTA